MTGAMTGTRPLALFVLRRDRVRLPVWLLGITAVTGASANAVVGVYDTPERQAGYAATVEGSAVSRLLAGVPHDVDTLGGIISFEVTALAAVAAALMTLFLVVRHTRAEEESGRDELVRSTVVGRHAPLAAAVLVALAASTVLGVLLGLVLLTSGVGLRATTLFGVGIVGVGLVFTGVAAVAAQVAGSARRAVGLGLTAILLAYLVRGYGAVDETWWTWGSPFGWQDELRPFGGEARWWPWGLSLATALALLVVAALLAAHRDHGAGLVAERPGPPHARADLGTPVGLALREQRGLLLGWAGGLLSLAVVFGSMSREVRTLVASNPEVAAVISAGLDDVVLAYLAYVAQFVGVTVGAYAVVSALRLHHEEVTGHAELVLSTGVSRTRWALAGMDVTVATTLGVLLLSGLGLALAHAFVEDDSVWVVDLVAATVATAPAALLLASVVWALHGWAPRWVLLAWVPVVWAFVEIYLGDLLDLPAWVRGLSPFHHLPAMPSESFSVTTAAVQLGLALLLAGSGLLGLRRRDLG